MRHLNTFTECLYTVYTNSSIIFQQVMQVLQFRAMDLFIVKKHYSQFFSLDVVGTIVSLLTLLQQVCKPNVTFAH